MNLVCIASWVHVKVQNGAKTVLWEYHWTWVCVFSHGSFHLHSTVSLACRFNNKTRPHLCSNHPSMQGNSKDQKRRLGPPSRVPIGTTQEIIFAWLCRLMFFNLVDSSVKNSQCLPCWYVFQGLLGIGMSQSIAIQLNQSLLQVRNFLKNKWVYIFRWESLHGRRVLCISLQEFLAF